VAPVVERRGPRERELAAGGGEERRRGVDGVGDSNELLILGLVLCGRGAIRRSVEQDHRRVVLEIPRPVAVAVDDCGGQAEGRVGRERGGRRSEERSEGGDDRIHREEEARKGVAGLEDQMVEHVGVEAEGAGLGRSLVDGEDQGLEETLPIFHCHTRLKEVVDDLAIGEVGAEEVAPVVERRGPRERELAAGGGEERRRGVDGVGDSNELLILGLVLCGRGAIRRSVEQDHRRVVLEIPRPVAVAVDDCGGQAEGRVGRERGGRRSEERSEGGGVVVHQKDLERRAIVQRTN